MIQNNNTTISSPTSVFFMDTQHCHDESSSLSSLRTRTTTKRRRPSSSRKRRNVDKKPTCFYTSSWTLIMYYFVILSCFGSHTNHHNEKCSTLQLFSTTTSTIGMAYGETITATTKTKTTNDNEESPKPTASLSSSATTRQKKYGRRTDETTNDISKLVPTTTSANHNATNTHATTMTWDQILVKAAKRGLGGGLPGAVAGVVQVISLMWLRTIINYQTRYGTSLKRAIVMLYNDGGIPRFYRGLPFALLQAPLSRFVSTAANDGVNTLLAAVEATKDWGPGRTTVVASIVVGLARILLMPIDTCKTVLQVNSAEGFRSLIRRVKAGKLNVLYEGALATALSALVAHYPWFYTYNLLSKNAFVERLVSSTLLRNAGIGLVASMVSDTVVNAFRVIKTTKQSIASKHAISYQETISIILASGGWRGLFGRGLQTRILANAIQSIVFTVIWRGLADRNKNTTNTNEEDTTEN